MNRVEFNDLSMALKKALVERALGAELTHHLGYASRTDRPEDASNHRNGASAKTVRTDDGPLRIEVPRDLLTPSSRCSSASTSATSPALTTRSPSCTRAA